MKIAYASDLHLEFGTCVLENKDNADVLVLAGDICVNVDLRPYDPYEILGNATLSHRYHDFFRDVSKKFKHVIYIMGNHEYYDGDFAKVITDMKEKLSYLKNIYILDREVKKIDDVTFIGSTLWTDMNSGDPLTLLHMKDRMNDFDCIKNSNRKVHRRVPIYKKDDSGNILKDEKGYAIQVGSKFKEEPAKFSPEDAAEYHRMCLDYIKHVVENRKEGDKFVVVGHHAPSIMSIHPKYKHDQIMNGGYMSCLEDFIIDRPAIKLWIHGHVHNRFDYSIGDTRVVCNPRGYAGFEFPRTIEAHELKTIEV
jgi:Icc-related predicted phosphoesterase